MELPIRGGRYTRVTHDTKHIFSEFDDPERQQLIADLVSHIPKLDETNRRTLFMLWFSDLDHLRRIVDMAPLLPIILTPVLDGTRFDAAGMCGDIGNPSSDRVS